MDEENISFRDILKLKNKNVTAMKVLFFKDVDADNILVSKKISSYEENYEYFIGYLYDDYKIKLLHVMLPKEAFM